MQIELHFTDNPSKMSKLMESWLGGEGKGDIFHAEKLIHVKLVVQPPSARLVADCKVALCRHFINRCRTENPDVAQVMLHKRWLASS